MKRKTKTNSAIVGGLLEKEVSDDVLLTSRKTANGGIAKLLLEHLEKMRLGKRRKRDRKLVDHIDLLLLFLFVVFAAPHEAPAMVSRRKRKWRERARDAGCVCGPVASGR